MIPTLGTSEDLRRCLSTVRDCRAQAIVLVTPQKNVGLLQKLCRDLGIDNAQVLGVSRANKRLQMIRGLHEVRTEITIFADDDVFWPKDFLVHMLAPFEDLAVGGVGPFNALERKPNPNGWDFLNAAYLKRWEWEVGATSNIDGGLACLSGRTSAILTRIVQNSAFVDAFANEKWFGTIDLLAADDDNFVTRWLANRGWKMSIQSGTSVTTTLDGNWKFLNQCLRWTRTTWRSNITALLIDRLVWHQEPYCLYALHLSMLNPPSLILDPLMGYCLVQWLRKSGSSPHAPNEVLGLGIFVLWLLFTKTVKLWGHFRQYPADIRYIPLQIAFGYFYGFIKMAALLTIHVVSHLASMIVSCMANRIWQTSWGGSRSSLVKSHSSQAATAIVDATKDLKSTIVDTGSKAIECSGLRNIGPDLNCNGHKALIAVDRAS